MSSLKLAHVHVCTFWSVGDTYWLRQGRISKALSNWWFWRTMHLFIMISKDVENISNSSNMNTALFGSPRWFKKGGCGACDRGYCYFFLLVIVDFFYLASLFVFKFVWLPIADHCILQAAINSSSAAAYLYNVVRPLIKIKYKIKLAGCALKKHVSSFQTAFQVCVSKWDSC